MSPDLSTAFFSSFASASEKASGFINDDVETVLERHLRGIEVYVIGVTMDTKSMRLSSGSCFSFSIISA